MRPRLPATTLWQAESYAHRTNRSVQDAIGILIDAGFRSITGTAPAAPAVVIDPSTNDDDANPGRTVAAHLPARMVAEIQHLAERERRSISFVLKALIRESLERRGLWRPARAPLLSPPAGAEHAT